MDVDVQELAKTYSEYNDEKLLSMHASGQLTEIASKILEKEIAQRGITIPVTETNLSGKIKIKLPASLKVAVGFVLVYGILTALEPILSGAPPYWIGRGFGVFILIIVLAWALLRVKKYGWGFSVFIICVQIFQLISSYRESTKIVTDPDELGAIFIGIVFYIVLLLVALLMLLLPGSRKPFKQLRRPSKQSIQIN